MKLKTVNDFVVWNISTRVIAFRVIYAEITKDFVAGLLLSQVVFWHLPTKNGYSKLRVKKDGRWWIAKKRNAWFAEIWISDRQYDRAIKILSKDKDGTGLDIVDVKLYKFNGKVMPHIAINYDKLFSLMNKQITIYEKQGDDTTYKKPKKVTTETKEDKYIAKVNSYLDKQTTEYNNTFDLFRDHRKKIKHPMTTYAEYLILSELEKYFPNNPSEHIERFKTSIQNGWQGVIFKNEKDRLDGKNNHEGY